MTPENKEHFLSEKEAIFLLLTGIGDDIWNGYSRAGPKRKPKTNKVKHEKEKTKSNLSQSQPNEENTT
ncbi:hypothetical protein Tco_0197537 [Tanacetum coccineum]